MINTLLSTLDKVKPNGRGKWLACCPAHPDKSPSLAIKQTDQGKLLIHCFSGCAVADVVAAVGLTLADLMPINPDYRKGSKPPRFNKYELFDKLRDEALILSLALRQLLDYQGLTPDDVTRVLLAERIINGIVKEVR